MEKYGEIEVGTCPICGKENVPLERTYYRYPIECGCHSPSHFDLKRHCKDCVPSLPEETTITFKAEDILNPLNLIRKLIKYSYDHDKVVYCMLKSIIKQSLMSIRNIEPEGNSLTVSPLIDPKADMKKCEKDAELILQNIITL